MITEKNDFKMMVKSKVTDLYVTQKLFSENKDYILFIWQHI
jgi:hypothetical protein